MSDAARDPTPSDDELAGEVTPAENGGGGSPRDTVEEDGLDEEVDDLFGDDDDAPP